MSILLVGFTGHENSSKLLLDLSVPKHFLDKLYADSRTERAKKDLIARMEQKQYDYIVIFAMKETLTEKNQLEFVLTASKDGNTLETEFLYKELEHNLHDKEIKVTFQMQSEEGIANELYYSSLKYCKEKEQKTRCLLINLPPIGYIDGMKASTQIVKYFTALVKAK